MSHRDPRRGKTSLVIYNRSRRLWEVLDYEGDRGVIAAFPPGPAGKQKSLECQIGLANPKALKLARRCYHRYPELTSRVLKAAQIVSWGEITPNGRGFWVRSQSNHDSRYVVGPNGNEDWECECIDFLKGIETQEKGAPWVNDKPFCKHILAVLMWTKLEEERSGLSSSGGKTGRPATRSHDSTNPAERSKLLQSLVEAQRAGIPVLF